MANLRRNILFILIIYLILGIMLELGLRLLPVQESMEWLPVDAGNPVRRFAPNRSFIYSKGWNFKLVNRLRSNNYGFISTIDYDRAAKIPVTAVIGDSFIEASIVDQPRTAVALLNSAARNKRHFYAFACSGSQLSTYIAYAKYARKEFHPDRYIFLLVGNDFDESWPRYGERPGYHYFVKDNAGTLTLRRVDYEVGFLKRLLRKSMLFMYLNLNLQIGPRLRMMRERIEDIVSGRQIEYVGQTDAHVDSRRKADAQEAVDAFFMMLEDACGVSRKNILIGIDGMRPQLYDAAELSKAEGSFFSDMRRHILSRARKFGHPVIDMEPVFEADYNTHKMVFEYPRLLDGHWNERAHALFANQIINSPFFE